MWQITSASTSPRSDAASCDLPAALRHRRDSHPSDVVGVGFFFEFELVRAESGPGAERDG